MKYLDIFEQLLGIITPAYMRKHYLKRYERLKFFFDERERINQTYTDERVRIILLNAAASALTGVKGAKFDELEYFLNNYSPEDFEVDYWSYVRNSNFFKLIRDENGTIIHVYSTKGDRLKTRLMNIFMILSMLIVPYFLNRDSSEFLKAFNALGISNNIIVTLYWVVVAICVSTIIKIIHDWICWSNLNSKLQDIEIR